LSTIKVLTAKKLAVSQLKQTAGSDQAVLGSLVRMTEQTIIWYKVVNVQENGIWVKECVGAEDCLGSQAYFFANDQLLTVLRVGGGETQPQIREEEF